MKVRIITEIFLENDKGETIVSDWIEEQVVYEDKWSVKYALERMREKGHRLFDVLRKTV